MKIRYNTEEVTGSRYKDIRAGTVFLLDTVSVPKNISYLFIKMDEMFSFNLDLNIITSVQAHEQVVIKNAELLIK